MILRAEKIPSFRRDFAKQFEWYARKAGSEVAIRFEGAVDATIRRLQENPTLGRPRHFLGPRMQNFRSFQVNVPFDRFLIFYRITEDTLEVRRLISGERDIPRRLPE